MPAETSEAKAELKKRLDDFAGQIGALGGVGGVDSTHDHVSKAFLAKFPARTHDEVAAEASKNRAVSKH